MSVTTAAPACVTTVTAPTHPGVSAASRQRAGEQQLDPDLAKLAAQLGLEIGPEPLTEHVIGYVKERHVLAGPDRLDLAGELDANRPGAEQQHPLCPAQRRVGRTDLIVRGGGQVDVTLGRERVTGPGGQDDVVGPDLLARDQHHPAGVYLGRAAADHPAVAEQPVVGQVDPRQPGWVHQRAE